MKDDKDKLSVLEPVDERLGDILSASLKEAGDGGQCPSPEDISALVEGRVTDRKRDEIMKHISSCDACCETFILSAQLHKEAITIEQIPKQRRNIFIFKPLALAASILIVIVSMYLFFKTDVPKTSEDLIKMEESKVDQDVRQPQPRVMMEAELKDKEKKPETVPTPGKYKRSKAKKGVPVVVEKEAPTAAGEGRVYKKTSEKTDRKLDSYKRRDHFEKLGKSVEKAEKKVEKKGGRIQPKKSAPVEVAADESRERTKSRGKVYSTLQRAEKPATTEQKKLEAEEQMVGEEQMAEFREKTQTESDRLNVQAGISDNKQFVLLQKNKIWSQANLLNQQSQVYKANIPAKTLQDMFRDSIAYSTQLKVSFEQLKKEAEKTGNFTELDAFIQGLAPIITIKTSKDISSIYPNVEYFLSLSAPGSMEYRFFNLARSGWCEPKSGCFDIEQFKPGYGKKAYEQISRQRDSSDLQLKQWKELQPNLRGIFQEIASYTIENIKQPQHPVPAER